VKKINIGLIGFGTVGSGVIKILQERGPLLQKSCDCEFFIKAIADKDITSLRQVKVNKNILTTNVEQVITDPQIEIIIELIGGINPARQYILKAFKKGKHVITANKALLAEYGQEISSAAKENNVNLLFEASVCSGIPIIKVLREGLIANKINSIFGIINGTSNYILTKMAEENMNFQQALTEAQAKGFAEADHSLDVGGVDSAHKLLILSRLAFGQNLKLSDIYTEGITDISPEDIRFAREFGYTVKLLAIARLMDKKLEVRVHPTLLSGDNLLSNVRGAYNAVRISGDLIGNNIFYGSGAGMMPTASAVVADLIDLARSSISSAAKTREVFPTGKQILVKKIEDIESKYYIRFQAVDRPAVLAQISGILGENKISIAKVIQKGRGVSQSVPIVMLTHDAREANLRSALQRIDKLAIIKENSVAIRIIEGK